MGTQRLGGLKSALPTMGRVLAVWAALAVAGVFFAAPTTVDALATPTPTPPPSTNNGCLNTSTGFTALTDLGPGTFQGEQGGLYPGGSNTPPSAYRAAGVQAGASVVPLDASGHMSANGRIVFLSIGMSNTSMEFSSFAKQELADSRKSASVAMVDGAQYGIDATGWTSPSAPSWGVVDQRLAAAGLTDQQVEVVWLKQALANPNTPFETYAHQLQQDLTLINADAAQRFPNLRQVFVSARTYGGYSGIYPKTPLHGPNPEPWAYETGWAVKWFVAQSVANPAQRPWVGWGPYWWTDGTVGRADGLKWYCSDTIDGTHPSSSGLVKIDAAMQALFTNSVFSPWFTRVTVAPAPSPAPIRPPAGPQAGASPGSTAQGHGHPISTGQGASNGAGGLGGLSIAAGAQHMAAQLQPLWLPTAAVLTGVALLIAFGISETLRRRRRPSTPPNLTRASPGANGSAGGNGAHPEVPGPPVVVGAAPPGDETSKELEETPRR
jgi:hypothetical protein